MARAAESNGKDERMRAGRGEWESLRQKLDGERISQGEQEREGLGSQGDLKCLPHRVQDDPLGLLKHLW